MTYQGIAFRAITVGTRLRSRNRRVPYVVGFIMRAVAYKMLGARHALELAARHHKEHQ